MYKSLNQDPPRAFEGPRAYEKNEAPYDIIVIL